MEVRSAPPIGALARSSAINVLGQLVPLVIAVAALPVLLDELGRDRFGLLTLAWAAVGTFSIFDLGLGRAATHAVATNDPAADEGLASGIVLLIFAALFLLGCLAGALLIFVAPTLISAVFDVPAEIRDEAESALRILSVSLPFVLASSATRGAIEGLNHFGLVNAIRTPSATLLFLSPLAVLPFTDDIGVIVATLTVNRILAFFAYLMVALYLLGGLGRARRPSKPLLRQTLTYAGWIGVTNAFGALLAWGYLDRYVVGAVLSVGAVAVYGTPLEIVTKLLLYPMALMAVFFPAFVRRYHLANGSLDRLHDSALRAIVLPLAPLVIAGVAASQALLVLYLGEDFASDATTVTQLLLVGAFSMCVAQVPFTVLQACGRSDLTAKRHIVQLAVYIPIVIAMTAWLGITGTAIVWAIWASSDCGILFYLARHYVGGVGALRAWLVQAAYAGVMFALAFISSLALDGWWQVLAGGALGAMAARYLWRALPDDDKRAVRNLLRGSDLPAVQP